MSSQEQKIKETKKLKKILFLIILICVVLLGIIVLVVNLLRPKDHLITNIQNYTTDIGAIKMDSNVKIIGLGEATHGNVEFQELKQQVFEAVLKNNNCKNFALEGDFGGGLKVNEYIHGGEGTAKEAAAEIGFALYRTAQIENLIQWMREYNEQVSADEQISFYGFDMQRYDNSKEELFRFLKEVGNEKFTEYQKALEVLNDDTVYDQDKQVIKDSLSTATAIQKELEDNKEAYVAKTDEKKYAIALECMHAIIENATLQTSSDYGNLRDGYMKERVDWIYEFTGEEMLFITGHDGHIDKSGAVKAYTSMGKQLAEEYGDRYFAIGTDFLEGEVNVVTSSGERGNVNIANSNDVTRQFEKAEGNIFYLDYQQATENEELEQFLNTKQSMINIGAELSDMQKNVKAFYTLNMEPAKAYDSLIVVKQVTPTDPLPLQE